MRLTLTLICLAFALMACAELDESASEPDNDQPGERALVTRVIDGDTIEVEIDGVGYRVRYIGVNTPERDEPCYGPATNRNRQLVENQTVRLVRDETNTDRFGRLLRYVYSGGTFVNERLVQDGFAEATLYEPDDEYHELFVRREQTAAEANLGCHPTGIFDDNTYRR
ncbi:MAG: thermonuclease family protein [Anaerolineales bacterium]